MISQVWHEMRTGWFGLESKICFLGFSVMKNPKIKQNGEYVNGLLCFASRMVGIR